MAFQKRHASTTTINYRGNHLKSQVLAILFYITPLNVFIIRKFDLNAFNALINPFSASSFCTDLFTAFLSWDLPVYREMCYLKVNHYEIFLAVSARKQGKILFSRLGPPVRGFFHDSHRFRGLQKRRFVAIPAETLCQHCNEHFGHGSGGR